MKELDWRSDRNKEMLGKNPETIRAFKIAPDVTEVVMTAGENIYIFDVILGTEVRVNERTCKKWVPPSTDKIPFSNSRR